MGERLQVHRTSVTNLVDGLEKLGYAERGPHERDRRTTLAAITTRGREVAGAATERAQRGRASRPRRWTRGELEELARVLRRVRAEAGDF